MADKPVIAVEFGGIVLKPVWSDRGGDLDGGISPGFWDWVGKVGAANRVVLYGVRKITERQYQAALQWTREKLQKHCDGYDKLGTTYMVEFAPERPTGAKQYVSARSKKPWA
jgi:hypothetical protein